MTGSGVDKPLKPESDTTQATGDHWWDPGYGYKKTKDGAKYTNPAGLGEELGQTRLGGIWEILGNPDALSKVSNPMMRRAAGGWGTTNRPQVTADQAMWLFRHATSRAQLAIIQQKMYFAGLYGDKVPSIGDFQEIDRNAFKKLLIGLASSPEQGSAAGYLDRISDSGKGLQGPKRAPLVVKVSSPDELRSVFQSVAQKIQGEFLPPAEVDRMVAAYQSLQAQTQTANYNAGDPSLTGTLDGGAGGTVAQLAGSAGDTGAAQSFAETQIKGAHPEQVGATQFGSLVEGHLNNLMKTGYLS